MDKTMKRILPSGKDGVKLIEVPVPGLQPGMALCRLTHSLISTGTEKSIIQRCMGKTVDEIKEKGVLLGYTGEGVVEEVCGDIHVKPGQRVAVYGGPYVSHSEYVAVPSHLLFPCPNNLDHGLASFIGLGAISMHGFRLGNAGLGDICLVAGAGLIGNLCAQLAIQAGCRVVISDFDEKRLTLLKNCLPPWADYDCVTPDKVEKAIAKKSGGRGADTVYPCMSTDSSKPMEQAIKVLRPGGTVSVLGVLDVRIPREEFFYKEANITISRAAGPGRYDPVYERDGVDYPVQYVRWTEGRNLEESLKLIYEKRLKVAPMISGFYTLDQVEELYSQIMNTPPGLGYIIQWRET